MVRDLVAQPEGVQAVASLIGATMQAPNAMSQQPGAFTAVRNQGVFDQIRRDAKSHMPATMRAGHHAIASARS